MKIGKKMMQAYADYISKTYPEVITLESYVKTTFKKRKKVFSERFLKSCDFCGKKFSSKYPNKRFCSALCNQRSIRKRKSLEIDKTI